MPQLEQQIKEEKLKLSRIVTAQNNEKSILEHLENEVKTKEKQLGDINANIEKDLIDTADLKERKKQLENEIKDTVRLNEQAKKELEQIKEEKEKIKMEIEKMKETFRIQSEDNKEVAIKELADINLKINEANSKAKDLNSLIAELEGKIKEKEYAITSYEFTILKLKDTVDNLEGVKEACIKEVAELNAGVNLLKDSRDMVSDTLIEIKNSIEKKKNEEELLDKTIKNKNEELQQVNASLKEMTRYRFNLVRKGNDLKRLYDYIVETYKQANVPMPSDEFDLIIPEIKEEENEE